MLCPYLKQSKLQQKTVLLWGHESEGLQAQEVPGLSPVSGAQRGFLPASVLTFPHLLKNRERKSIFFKPPFISFCWAAPWTWFNMVKVLFRQWPCPSPREWLTSFWKFLEYSDSLCNTCLKGAIQEAKQVAKTQVAPKVMKRVMVRTGFQTKYLEIEKHGQKEILAVLQFESSE